MRFAILALLIFALGCIGPAPARVAKQRAYCNARAMNPLPTPSNPIIWYLRGLADRRCADLAAASEPAP